MNFVDIIAKRRDGVRHTPDDFRFIAEGAAKGDIPDYQLAAWLMAAYLKPLDKEETAALTLALAGSGDRIDLDGLPEPWIDKHSTGGVGDKTSIVLMPLLASCGVTILKLSGRGLGITGGTIDKLASIPGFRTDLQAEEAKSQAKRIGLALGGQTGELAPADGVLYGLRDVTATIGSVPLIVSSILSKKLAGGAKTVLLDVKCGSGSFMPEMNAARYLAEWLVAVGSQIGLSVKAVLSDMDRPLGRCVGNALEVKEAFEVLRGDTETRFAKFCLDMAGKALEMCGKRPEMAHDALAGGSALRKAYEWLEAQGADMALFREGDGLPSAAVEVTGRSDDAGWVERVDAETVGRVVLNLGGGRVDKADPIDPSVGVEVLVETGDWVEPGKPLYRVHAASQAEADVAVKALRTAFRFGQEPVPPRPTILSEL